MDAYHPRLAFALVHRLTRANRLLATAIAVFVSGCGVVWDADGSRHALGLGYVSWPLAPAYQTTVVEGVDVAGAALLLTRDEMGVVIGYDRQRSVKLDDNQLVTLDCLQCDLAASRANARSVAEQKGRP